jgi:hypothetical protein
VKIERRVTRGDGSGYLADGNGEQAAETLRRGRAILAEARAAYGLRRGDSFTAYRAHGTIVVSNVKRVPMHPDDELLDARAELIALKAKAVRGGVR